MKTLSPLQIERLQYQPKLPQSLQAGIKSLDLVEGAATQSVRDQDEIKSLFPNCYGGPTVTFRASEEEVISEKRNIVLSFQEDKLQVDTMLLQVFMMQLNKLTLKINFMDF